MITHGPADIDNPIMMEHLLLDTVLAFVNEWHDSEKLVHSQI